MIGYFMGYLAPLKLTPEGKENPAILSTNSWRYVFIIPGIIAITHSLLLLFVFKYDTPKYYRQVGNEVMARKVELEIDPDSHQKNNLPKKEVEKEEKVPVSKHCSPLFRWALVIG